MTAPAVSSFSSLNKPSNGVTRPCAIFVSGEPLVRVAERFSYKVATLKSVVSRFRADRRRGVTPPFFCTTVEDDLPVNGTPWTKTGPSCQRSPTADN